MKLEKANNGFHPVKLESVIAEATTGFACGRRADDGVIQIRMNNVTRRGELDWSNVLRVPSEMTDLESFALRSGDVLFNNTNSTEMVGKTACFDTFKEPVVFSNHFTRLRADTSKLDSGYLALWLHKQFLDGLFAKICDRWIGQSAVQRNKLLGLEISLPPVTEQRRIAARLREQMAEAERARAAVQAQLDAAQKLPAALLRAIFTSPAAARWQRKPLGEVANLLSSRPIATEGESEVHAVTSACLTESGFSSAGIKTARMHTDDVAISTIQPGEILIARSNTPALVGRSAQFNGETQGVVASDLTIRISPSESLRGAILAAYLSFIYLSGYWIERASGASGTMKKITRSQTVALPVPIPPIFEQRAIAARLESELTAARLLCETLETRLAEIERLPAALLRAAFSQAN